MHAQALQHQADVAEAEALKVEQQREAQLTALAHLVKVFHDQAAQACAHAAIEDPSEDESKPSRTQL